MPDKPKLSLVARLAFLLAGLATLTLVGFLLWAGFIAPLNSRMPVPSPDGKYFAYFNPLEGGQEWESGARELIISRPQGQMLGRLRIPAGRLIWSNANHLIVVDQTASQATLIANAAERFVVLTRIPLSPEGELRWAPDGNKLACVRRIETGRQLVLHDIQQPQAFPIPLPADYRLNQTRLIAWSPGSEYLYFLNVGGQEAVLQTVEVHSGNLRALARGLSTSTAKLPLMSPDGSKVLIPPPQNTVVDAQSGAPIWGLPPNAQPVLWPWSSDSQEIYYSRQENASEIFGHNLVTSVDRLAVSGVRTNGFFTLDGSTYFYREASPPPQATPAIWHDWRKDSWGWQRADRTLVGPQDLGRVELWPWEQTQEGLILARRDDYTRVRFGLYDPDAHAFDPFIFPTDSEDLSNRIRSYRLLLASVVLFTFLAVLVLAKRAESKAARAFYVVMCLVTTLACGSFIGNAEFLDARLSPYRMTLEEIAGLGWWMSRSLPQLVFDRARLTLACLWALLPLATLHLGLHFPDRTQFLKRQKWIPPALYAVAFLPVVAMFLARFVPALSQNLLRDLAFLAGALVAGVWVLSLGANLRRPPDKRSREQVRWMIAALGSLGLGYLALAGARYGEMKMGAGDGRAALHLLRSALFVLVAWVVPAAVAYAVAARKPSRLGRFLPRLFRQILMGVPALAMFTIVWALTGLIVSGSLWAFSAPAVIVAVLLTVIVVLPFRGRLRLAIDRMLDRPRLELREKLAVFARSLPHTVDRETLATQLEQTVSGALRAKRTLLFVVDRQARRLRLQPGKSRLPAEVHAVTFDLRQPLCEYLMQNDEPFEPMVAAVDEDLQEVMSGAGEQLRKLQAEVILGLRRNELVGLLVVGAKASGELYDSDELDSLRMIAREAAAAIENIELFEAVARDREIRKELEDAMEIQAKLFPAHVPRLASGQLAGCCFPARATGGDYYDFLQLPQRRVGLAMSDVPGRGMPAVLLMASVESLLHAQAATAENLTTLIQELNRQLLTGSPASKLCTLFYGVYDDATRQLEYINAGHPSPVLLTAGGAQFLEPTGLPLGLFPDITHEPRSLVLEPGTTLLIYSDGVVDARNGRGDTFGRDRVASALFRERESDAERALARVVTEVRDFEGGTLLEDDQTLLLLKLHAE